MKKILVIILLIFVRYSFGQTGIGTRTPHVESAVEITSPANNKGLLFNVISLTSISSPSPLSAHREGMVVYNTATTGTSPNNVTPGMYYNDGSKWHRMEDNEQVGAVKQSFINVDHNGWYILNGRLVSTLPQIARTAALTLGFSTNIPNSENLFIKGKKVSEPIFSIAGSPAFTILQANLPFLTFSGTTVSSGLHSHSYTNKGNTVYHAPNAGTNNFQTYGSTTNGFNTSSNGVHTHTVTVPTGGSDTPVPLTPMHTVVQTFIYLGY